MEDLLEIVQNARAENGASSNDFKRFQMFCTRRIRKAPEQLKWLLLAERAWAKAQLLKIQINHFSDKRDAARKYRDLKRKFSRAVLYADRLHASINLPQTHAYLSIHTANLAFVRNDYEVAYTHFAKAKSLLEALASISTHLLAAVCHSFIDEIEPSMRYCGFALGKTDVDLEGLLEIDSDTFMGDTTLLKIKSCQKHQSTGTGPSDSRFGTELSSTNKDLAEKLLRFERFKHTILEDLVMDEQQDLTLVKAAITSRLESYDSLVGICLEAEKCSETDVALDKEAVVATKTSKSIETSRLVFAIYTYTVFLRLQITLSRTMFLLQAHSFKSELELVGKKMDAKLVKVDEGIKIASSYRMQFLADYKKLYGTNEHVEGFMEFLEAFKSVVDGLVNLAFAKYYFKLGKFKVSIKVCDEGLVILENVVVNLEALNDSNGFVKTLIDVCQNVGKQLSAQLANTVASCYLEQSGTSSKLSTKLVEMELSETKEQVGLYETMDKFTALEKDKEFVVVGKPGLQAIPFRPIFYDLAYDYVANPELELEEQVDVEMKEDDNKKNTGFLSGVLGGIWGNK